MSHETLYKAIYAIPRGVLRKDLIACLRQSRKSRRPRARGKDRRGKIPKMFSIHIRSAEIEERLVPGHWEGDLIKGAKNASSVGTLVERTSLFVTLVKLDSASAEDAQKGFAHVLNRIEAQKRLSMTYDQGKEMVCQKKLAEDRGIKIYFADPHSPWKRGINENTNGLLRQYMPKGTDLSVFTQDELDQIAWELNTRPRKTLNSDVLLKNSYRSLSTFLNILPMLHFDLETAAISPTASEAIEIFSRLSYFFHAV